MACALESGDGTGVWEGGGSARGSEWRPRGAGGGSAALELGGRLKAAAQLWRAARRRQRGYGGRGIGGGSATPVGAEEAAARLRYIDIGGEEVATRLRRPGDGSAARREARIRQRGSVGGTHGDGSAVRREARRLGGSAAPREARRRQRGSEGGPEVAVRLGGRPGDGTVRRAGVR